MQRNNMELEWTPPLASEMWQHTHRSIWFLLEEELYVGHKDLGRDPKGSGGVLPFPKGNNWSGDSDHSLIQISSQFVQFIPPPPSLDSQYSNLMKSELTNTYMYPFGIAEITLWYLSISILLLAVDHQLWRPWSWGTSLQWGCPRHAASLLAMGPHIPDPSASFVLLSERVFFRTSMIFLVA